MSKRRNENGQMRREEYEAAEAADDDVSADSFDKGFERASEDSIRKRKIVKARVGGRPPAAAQPRANAAIDAASDAPCDSAVKSNPFGGFQGLTAAKPAASNPFAGFSGLTGTASEKTDTTRNGSSANSSASYQEAIQSLNNAFLIFVKDQLQKNPSASWVAAVQDYLRYEAEIATKHASTKPVMTSGAERAEQQPSPFSATQASAVNTNSGPTASSSTSFSFGEHIAGGKKNDDESRKDLPDNGFSFGATQKKDLNSAQSASKGSVGSGPDSLFSAKPSDREEKLTAAFSFGTVSKPADMEEKPTAAFSFGTVSKPADSAASSTPAGGGWSFNTRTAHVSSGGFSFGTLAPVASASPPIAEGNEDENIGREEATVVLKADSSDDDCTFEVDKAKIFEFKKDEKRWADKGIHPLKVLVSKDSKSARILVRNEIGKVVLNSALYKGLTVRPHESKGKKTGVTLALQIDSTLTQFLIKVNASRVDDFIQALEAAAAASS